MGYVVNRHNGYKRRRTSRKWLSSVAHSVLYWTREQVCFDALAFYGRAVGVRCRLWNTKPLLKNKFDMKNKTLIKHENGNDANRLLADVKITEFKVGMSFRAVVPFSQPNTIKVHIDHILPSIYEGRKLIIYRVFGKHKQWWHEKMCTDKDMQWYKERAERK